MRTRAAPSRCRLPAKPRCYRYSTFLNQITLDGTLERVRAPNPWMNQYQSEEKK